MPRRPDVNEVVGENSLRSLSDLLAEVRAVVDTALAKAEDCIQERLARMQGDGTQNGQPPTTRP